MPLNTYDELKAEVQSFLWDRADVVAKIPTFISLAESEVRRLIRTRNVNDSRQFSYAGDQAAIPCGAAAIKAIQIDEGGSSRDLDYVSPEMFSALSDPKTGTPRFYTVQNERIYFYPQGATQGRILFVDPFEPLSKACRCNWLLEEHPDIYLCGALKWGKMWLIDSDQDWASPFYSAIEAANASNPRVQTNTRLRADEASMVVGRSSFDMLTGGL